MEQIKTLDNVCLPDVRQNCFAVFDANTGSMRKQKLEDFHCRAESISLHEGVPEEIRNHFQTARNLIIYSWFYYPFNVTARMSAYISVEFALRIKTGDRKSHFSQLMKMAVNSGWISDKDFSVPMRRLESVQRMNEGAPPEFHVPEPTLEREYCDVLAKSFPSLRNSLAHGSSFLSNDGAFAVRICAELINQLFSPPGGVQW